MGLRPWAFGLAGLLAVVLPVLAVVTRPAFPACGGAAAARMVTETFRAHILSQILQLEMTGLARQRTIFSGKHQRVCAATATVNGQPRDIVYTFRPTGTLRAPYALNIEDATTLGYGSVSVSRSLRRQFSHEP